MTDQTWQSAVEMMLGIDPLGTLRCYGPYKRLIDIPFTRAFQEIRMPLKTWADELNHYHRLDEDGLSWKTVIQDDTSAGIKIQLIMLHEVREIEHHVEGNIEIENVPEERVRVWKAEREDSFWKQRFEAEPDLYADSFSPNRLCLELPVATIRAFPWTEGNYKTRLVCETYRALEGWITRLLGPTVEELTPFDRLDKVAQAEGRPLRETLGDVPRTEVATDAAASLVSASEDALHTSPRRHLMLRRVPTRQSERQLSSANHGEPGGRPAYDCNTKAIRNLAAGVDRARVEAEWKEDYKAQLIESELIKAGDDADPEQITRLVLHKLQQINLHERFKQYVIKYPKQQSKKGSGIKLG